MHALLSRLDTVLVMALVQAVYMVIDIPAACASNYGALADGWLQEFSVWINGIGTMAGYIQIISISIWPTTLDETVTRI